MIVDVAISLAAVVFVAMSFTLGVFLTVMIGIAAVPLLPLSAGIEVDIHVDLELPDMQPVSRREPQRPPIRKTSVPIAFIERLHDIARAQELIQIHSDVRVFPERISTAQAFELSEIERSLKGATRD
jgi:hypothetical protein